MHLQRQIKKLGGIFGFLLICFISRGQANLVVNPSFEDYTGPCSSGDFGATCASSSITGWSNPTGGSPDWYNTCRSYPMSVPSNAGGYQYPHSGSAYAGFVMVSDPKQGFEYLEGTFTKPLSSKKNYCVSFYVSLADSLDYGCASIGAYIPSAFVCMPGVIQDTLPFIPQIENPLSNPITDKINWINISGQYNASGGERNIIIGRFDSSSGYTYVGGGGYGNNVYGQTYYYVDDVSIREIIQASAGGGKDTAICIGNSVLIGQDPAIAGISYKWAPVVGLTNPNAAQTLASPTVTTTYTLIIKNDSMKGCSCPDSISRDSITVRVKPYPILKFNGDTLSGCSSVCVNFKDSSSISSGSILSWLWNFGDGDSSSIQNPSHCYTSPGEYSVRLTLVTDSGCKATNSIPNMISVYSRPLANFSIVPQTTTIQNPNIQFSDSSKDTYGIKNWYWNFGDNTNSNQQNPLHTYQDTGIYCVKLTVDNIHGCMDSTIQCVTISPEALPCNIFIPTAFSPNKDGQNDILLVRGNCVATFNMVIYDRWGNKVFESHDISTGWDGVYGGKPEDAGTFVYFVNGTYTNGNNFSQKGDITLVR